MPFTLSHPAAILPLSRRPLVASALVAGAVAPDLPYLLPQATSAAWGPYSDYNLTYTHQLSTGMVAGTIGALILLALFHHLLKRPLLALLPAAAAGRLARPAAEFRWSGAARAGWLTWWWRSRSAPSSEPPVTFGPAARGWIVAALVMAGLLAAVVQLARNDYGVLDAVRSAVALRLAVTGAMSGVGVAVLVYGLLWLRSHRDENR